MALERRHQFDLSLSTDNRPRSKGTRLLLPVARVDLDVETFSELDLRQVGVHKYAAHPSTDVWLVAYSINGGPVQRWHRRDPVPLAFLTLPKLIGAHSAHFEYLIWRHVLAPRYGWATPEFENFDCTLVRSLAMALPAKLERLAIALGLEHQKDPSSQRLMLSMARPRRARKNEDPAAGPYWNDEPARWRSLEPAAIWMF